MKTFLARRRRLAGAITAFSFSICVCAGAASPPPAGAEGGASAPAPRSAWSQGHLVGSGSPPLLAPGHPVPHRAPLHVARRRGLAVIADFADNRLEDWQGPGFNDVGEVRGQLRRMALHWAWLSRGGEAFDWDVIRIVLPQPLGPDAYPDWWAYREAVGTLIRQQVDVARYDQDHDGVVDTAWVIASNHGMQLDYVVGGTSQNAGVNLFVDGQDSLSVVSGATGNFNHETAHTLGVPDLYGPYETLHYLTLMSDSWALPPQDFTAYERTLLGWLTPRRLPVGSQDVRLSSSPVGMHAVRVDGPRPSEYFLVEYRRRPARGFGSRAPDYGGLAVYHLLEGSSQQVDPPLDKLEAADGAIAPDAFPVAEDFLYPGNPAMQRPLVLRSYFGGGEVFRIGDVRADGRDALAFHVRVASPAVHLPDLIVNGSFEQGLQAPDAWRPNQWEQTTTFAWDTQVTRTGQRSASIASPLPNDAAWLQDVSNLEPGRAYELCGWLKGDGIVTGPDAGMGANVSVFGGFVSSAGLSGTFDWTQACVVFRAEAPTVTVACRLGFFGSVVTGRLWCDDLTLTPMRSAFE